MIYNYLVYYCLLIIFPIVSEVHCNLSKSGFYFDNGDSMTTIAFMDQEEQEMLREEMLLLLGLTHAPDTTVHKKDSDHHTIPYFMKDIYKSLTVSESPSGEMRPYMDENLLLNNQFGITEEDIRVIKKSDTIMSFPNRGRQHDLKFTKLFWFDTSELPDSQEQKLIRAELRIYKFRPNNDIEIDKRKFTIKCYQLVEGTTDEDNVLDVVEIEINDEGWLIFDLTNAVKSWQLDFHTNLGLRLKIEPEVKFSEIGIYESSMNDDLERPEPFMVAYFSSMDGHDSFYHRYRKRRDIQDISQYKSRSKRSSNRNFNDYYGGQDRNTDCSKRTFVANFKDLGWTEWIIAPNEYEAHFCRGECSFPLTSDMNATNHAIIQTYLSLMKKHETDLPLCAPLDLASINVLFYDENLNVLLKRFSDMIVKTCGCQ